MSQFVGPFGGNGGGGGGGPPSGAAGGDLTGTYPNPTIAAAAVTATKIAVDAVITAKILDANVTTAKLAAASVTQAKLDQTLPIEGTTAELFIKVTTGGSDTPTLTRPTRLLGGDYTSEPFLTLQAAVDSIPKSLRYGVTVKLDAGIYTGAIIAGFSSPAGALIVGATERPKFRIVGDWAVTTVTTGAASGTAGTGTTNTAFKKPNAAADWTVDDLRGRFIRITSGSGNPSGGSALDFAQTLSLVKSNTIDTATTIGFSKVPATLPAITTVDNTSVFEIVEPSVILRKVSGFTFGLAVVNNDCDVIAHGLKFDNGVSGTSSAFQAANCAAADVAWCLFDGVTFGTIGAGISNQRCWQSRADAVSFKAAGWSFVQGSFARVSDCVFTSSNGPTYSNLLNCDSRRNTLEGSSAFTVSNCNVFREQGGTTFTNNAGSAAAYTLQNNLQVRMDAATGSTTGTLTSGSSTGLAIDRCPDVFVNASVTVTGATGDMKINGSVESYANLAAAPSTTIIRDLTLLRRVSP